MGKDQGITIEVSRALSGEHRAAIDRYMADRDDAGGACGELDPRWLDVLREGLGHEPWVVLAWSEAEAGAKRMAGYLPLALVRSLLFGKFLVSLPYLNRAFAACDDDSVRLMLTEAAINLAKKLDVKYLELRMHLGTVDSPRLNFRRDEKFRMVLELPETEEQLWKGISAKVRNLIRKGDSHALSMRWTSGLSDDRVLSDFYDVFAVNMRDLGTPVYGRKLFASILTHFGQQAEIGVVDFEGKPVAGALLIHDRLGRMVPSTQVPSASSLRAFNSTNANMWMYHRLLLRAIEKGSRRFDFGRSSEDSGTYRFKKQWGAMPYPTVWQYSVFKGDVNAMRPDSAGNRRKVELWQKLPVGLTRWIGPRIVRGIP